MTDSLADLLKQLDDAATSSPEEAVRNRFLTVLDGLERMFRAGVDGLRTEVLPRLIERAAKLSSRVRMAPLHWTKLFVIDGFPAEGLGLFSAMSFSPLLAKHHHASDLEAWLAWLSRLPADAPALEGLDLRFRTEGPFTAFDTNVHHYLEEHLGAMLGSPVCRALRVLDLSLDEFQSDLDQAAQEETDGRFVTVAMVAKMMQASTLEVLNLYGHPTPGQAVGYLDEVCRERLSRLRVLDLGGAFPIGDRDVMPAWAVQGRPPPLSWDEAVEIMRSKSVDDGCELLGGADWGFSVTEARLEWLRGAGVDEQFVQFFGELLGEAPPIEVKLGDLPLRQLYLDLNSSSAVILLRSAYEDLDGAALGELWRVYPHDFDALRLTEKGIRYLVERTGLTELVLSNEQEPLTQTIASRPELTIRFGRAPLRRAADWFEHFAP